MKIGDIVRVTKMFNIASGMRLNIGDAFQITNRVSFGLGDYPTVFYSLRSMSENIAFEMVDIVVSFMEY